MMMLETGLDELQAGSSSYRHMTRVAKVWIFPQLEHFTKLQNRTLFFEIPNAIWMVLRCRSQKCSRNRIL